MSLFQVAQHKDEGRGIGPSLIGLVMVAVIPLLIFGIIVVGMTVSHEKSELANNLAGTARALQVTVDHDLVSQFAAMETLASEVSGEVSGEAENFSAFNKESRQFTKAHGDWLNAVLIDPHTHIIVASVVPLPTPALTTVSPATADEVTRTRKPAIAGAFAVSAVIKQPVILLMSPVVRDNVVRYVLAVAISPKRLNNLFVEQQLPASWTGAILDSHMMLAGRSRDPERYIGVHATPTLAARIASRERGMFKAVNQEGEDVYTVFTRSPATGWSVAIGVPSSEVDAPFHSTLLHLATAGGTLMAFALIFASMVGRGIVRRRNVYEQMIKDSESKYRTLFETANDGIFLQDATGFLDCNQKGADMYGLTREEVIGRSPADFSPERQPDGRLSSEVAKENIAAAMRSGVARFEWQPIRTDGIPFDVEVTLSRTEYCGSPCLQAIVRDITERKRGEHELRKLSIAVEQSPASVVITDLDASIQYVNPRFVEVTGYTAAEAIGQNPRILQSKQTPPETYLEMWDKLSNGYPWRGELINKRKNGEIYYEESHIAPVKNHGGAITHYVAVKTDITARKRAESTLQEQKNFLATILETEPECVKVVGADGTLLQMNKAGLSMLEANNIEEINARGLANLVVPEHREAFMDVLRQVFAGEDRTLEFKVQALRGTRRLLETHATPLRDSVGNINYMLAVTRDITQRKQAEQAILNESKKNEALLNTASDGIHILDEQGNLVQYSHSFARMLGYGNDELVRLNVTDWDFQIPQDQLVHEVNKLIKQPATFETKHRRKDGSVIDVEINAKGVELGGKHYLYASARDITERKKAEYEIHNLAFYDTLTQLPNRRLLNDRLKQALVASRRSGHYGVLMFLDLDNFKPLNDLYGHNIGDLLLIEVAYRINGCVRGIDTVSRFGGDEFIVMLSELEIDKAKSTEEGSFVAEKIRSTLAEPYLLTVQQTRGEKTRIKYLCTASIGLVIFNYEITPEEILKWADKAMYQAKEDGRNTIRIYMTQ